MGFLDKAKATASGLAAKADGALSSTASSFSGGGGGPSPDALLHDLGILSYLEATGRPAAPEDRDRVMAALQEAEQRGTLRSFALRTATPAAPPPPGAAAAAPPPPGASAAPPPAPASPPPAPGAAPPAAPEGTQPAPPPTQAPPPPPSWA
ncbi:hypothetical protein Q6348_01240 [Isoptericola sp. b441]|uniref:Uncharacterized protein n=1 Tax=Actinotalea lenta TaxID=3064654 RepID=A0ABT9D6Z5_9CELL|nr:hypothetical protein [Isoptericola sp. b441]MDO8105818.1 hypothetical protein [Isoptericola sp. b441]